MGARLVDHLCPLLRQLQVAKERARALGLFTNDRELLACRNCGLTEDILASGQLISNHEIGSTDTGLRFLESSSKNGHFTCPECGADVQAPESVD
jgi:hypothetical protein